MNWTPTTEELLENKVAVLEYENDLLIKGLAKMTKKYHRQREGTFACLSLIVLLLLLLCL